MTVNTQLNAEAFSSASRNRGMNLHFSGCLYFNLLLCSLTLFFGFRIGFLSISAKNSLVSAFSLCTLRICIEGSPCSLCMSFDLFEWNKKGNIFTLCRAEQKKPIVIEEDIFIRNVCTLKNSGQSLSVEGHWEFEKLPHPYILHRLVKILKLHDHLQNQEICLVVDLQFIYSTWKCFELPTVMRMPVFAAYSEREKKEFCAENQDRGLLLLLTWCPIHSTRFIAQLDENVELISKTWQFLDLCLHSGKLV